uniref:At1g61320/AtMIF1 LRR domain-containing protein n=1 Tax=Chenopodium quinoa TaxID=63459 RepID=A0A803MIW1_CHEQI
MLDSGIIFLTSLHLSDVQVSGEFLEFLLSVSPLLEQLYVKNSMILVRLKVAFFKLKQLTIDRCARLEELEIDAVNLSYLYYAGFGNIEFKSVPALVEAKLFGDCCTPSILICQKIASFAMQLSRLSLVLVLESCDEVDWGGYILLQEEARVLQGLESLPCIIKYKALPRLKVLEYVGYDGSDDDVDLLLYLLDMATQLDTFICRPVTCPMELDLLSEDANVYKLIGPVLVKQDLAEANANVRKRIEYISAELKRLDATLQDMEDKQNSKKEG